MPDLHIVACVKVVPKAEEIRVDPATKALLREGVRSEINPPDMNAMEAALRLKDRYGARVTILSMGPPFVTPYLRAALAMGADHIVLLSDRAFGGADTLATTYTLAKGIEKLGGADLVICGEESSDGATGQVPPGLAEWLSAAQISVITRAEIDLNRWVVRGWREIRGGHEVLEVPLPAVLSVKTAANEPRFMDYAIKEWALEPEQVTVWSRDDLKVDDGLVGLVGSPTRVAGLEQAASRQRKREYLSGSPDEIASTVAESLHRILLLK